MHNRICERVYWVLHACSMVLKSIQTGPCKVMFACAASWFVAFILKTQTECLSYIVMSILVNNSIWFVTRQINTILTSKIKWLLLEIKSNTLFIVNITRGPMTMTLGYYCTEPKHAKLANNRGRSRIQKASISENPQYKKWHKSKVPLSYCTLTPGVQNVRLLRSTITSFKMIKGFFTSSY